jgi:hypothetical protein
MQALFTKSLQFSAAFQRNLRRKWTITERDNEQTKRAQWQRTAAVFRIDPAPYSSSLGRAGGLWSRNDRGIGKARLQAEPRHALPNPSWARKRRSASFLGNLRRRQDSSHVPHHGGRTKSVGSRQGQSQRTVWRAVFRIEAKTFADPASRNITSIRRLPETIPVQDICIVFAGQVIHPRTLCSSPVLLQSLSFCSSASHLWTSCQNVM